MFWVFYRSVTLTVILGAKKLHRQKLAVKFYLSYYKKNWNLPYLSKIVKADQNPLNFLQSKGIM